MKNFITLIIMITIFSGCNFFPEKVYPIDQVVRNGSATFEVNTINQSENTNNSSAYLPNAIQKLFNNPSKQLDLQYDYQIESLNEIKEILENNNYPYKNFGYRPFIAHNFPGFRYGYIPLVDNTSHPFDPLEYAYLIRYEGNILLITILNRNLVQAQLLK